MKENLFRANVTPIVLLLLLILLISLNAGVNNRLLVLESTEVSTTQIELRLIEFEERLVVLEENNDLQFEFNLQMIEDFKLFKSNLDFLYYELQDIYEFMGVE